MTVIGRPLPEPIRIPLTSLPPVKRTHPDPPPNATVVQREDVTAALGVFTIHLDQAIVSFRPGQYVSLGIDVHGERVQRPYSIVSCTANGTRLELFVRRLPDGRFSNLLWSLSPGDRLTVGPARGLFALDAGDRRPRVMVGTGTGVAPLLAMLQAAYESPSRTATVLIHGASFADELAFDERVRSWTEKWPALDYRPTVSRPDDLRNSAWTARTGRVEAQLDTLMDEWRWLRAGGSAAYLCGNPEMVAECTEILRGAGFSSADVHVELFHAPGRAAK